MTKSLNNLKTAGLLGLLFGVALLVGSHWGQQGMTIAFVFAALMNFGAYFFSDKIALAMMSCQQVDERTAPDLVHMVERLARNAGLPMPRVFISPQEAPNAFATGRNPTHAAVAVTQGALRLLDYDELEGVIGHELAHVKNRDTLTSAIAATLAGALTFLARMAFWTSGDRRDGNPLAGLLMVILAPLAAMLIKMAISRSREYVADHDGARIAGTPHGLINALRKLDATAGRVPLAGESPAFNHMFIVQPLSGEGFAGLFSSHPPTAKRIAKLSELG